MRRRLKAMRGQSAHKRSKEKRKTEEDWKMNKSNIGWMLVLIALLLAVTGGVSAQDVLPGEPPVVSVPGQTETVLTVALAAALVLVGLFGAALVVLGRWLYNSMPPWTRDLIARNYDMVTDAYERLDKRLDEWTDATPGAFDDELQEMVDERVRVILGELRPPPPVG